VAKGDKLGKRNGGGKIAPEKKAGPNIAGGNKTVGGDKTKGGETVKSNEKKNKQNTGEPALVNTQTDLSLENLLDGGTSITEGKGEVESKET